MAFTSSNHYLDVEWMEYAYECTRKDGAVGVDGQTAEEYAVDLRHNLTDLIDRLKSGRYRAPPLRRHYIDKAGGGKRGLVIPSFEDKVAQRAIVMLLEPIFEQDFRDCSFGYRPGRNAHQALQVLRSGIMERRGYWVVEVDVQKFFDSIPRTTLRDSIARRVTDGVVRRLIDKWLHAGVLESGQVHYPDAGTPQGSVISPTLSNVVLSSPRYRRMVHPTGATASAWFEYTGPKDRLARSLKAFNQQCRLMRHWPLDTQHERLCAMLKGHYGYFGISGNIRRLGRVCFRVQRLWRVWLSRRSWKSSLPWMRYARLLQRFPLPQPRIVHRYTMA